MELKQVKIKKYVPYFLLFFVFLGIACEHFFDFSPPDLDVSHPSDGKTYYGDIPLELSAKDAHFDKIELYIDGTKKKIYKKDYIKDTLSLSPGSYTLLIKAFDVGGNWSKKEVKITIKPLESPRLSSPSNGDTITDNTPSFDWSDVPGAEKYWLQVGNNSDFSSPEISDSNITGSNYTSTKHLSDGKHYWRVKAGNGRGSWGNWSNVWNFTIITQGPPPPNLYQPVNNHTITDNTPYFDWSDVNGAVKYQIQVDNNSNFSSPEIDNSNITVSNFTQSTSLADGTYYWRVKAQNSVGFWGNCQVCGILQ